MHGTRLLTVELFIHRESVLFVGLMRRFSRTAWLPSPLFLISSASAHESVHDMLAWVATSVVEIRDMRTSDTPTELQQNTKSRQGETEPFIDAAGGAHTNNAVCSAICDFFIFYDDSTQQPERENNENTILSAGDIETLAERKWEDGTSSIPVPLLKRI